MALMRFTGPRLTAGSTKGGLYAGAGGNGNWSDFGEVGTPRVPVRLADSTGADECVRPVRERDYLLAAGNFVGSGAADGIVVTRPCVPVACAGTATGAAAGIIPSALRTSVSSFAIVSLFSLRNARAFSRPCPMRSPL